MGKVHRIKKAFHRVIAQEPWKELQRYHVTYIHFARYMTISIGRRSDDSYYIGYYSRTHHSLMKKLIREWEASGGVAQGDKGSIKS